MLKVNVNEELKKMHVKFCKNYILKKIDKDPKISIKIINIIKNNLDLILSCNVDSFVTIQKKYNKIIHIISYKTNKSEKELNTILSRIFNYEAFCKNEYGVGCKESTWTAYDLVSKIGLGTCPYCNENYIPTVYSKKGKMRPEIDHFYPKSKYPILALSYHNLIPSCHSCNHIKSDKELYINPYNDNFNRNDKFYLDIQLDCLPKISSNPSMNDFKINFYSKNPDKNNQNDKLLITLRYNQRKDLICGLLAKINIYNKSYKEEMKALLNLENLSDEEFYRFLFNSEMFEKNFHKMPFSKLFFDLINTYCKLYVITVFIFYYIFF